MHEVAETIPESQALENRLVWEFFSGKPGGFFVEVGANDPCLLSQTWHLEQHGWSGVLVEPLSSCCDLLRKTRKHSKVFQVACSAEGGGGKARFYVSGARSSLAKNAFDPGVSYERSELVTIATLNEVLDQAGAPSVIDFLSIDVEGTELDVLRGLDIERYRPRLILVEYHVYSLSLHRYLVRSGYKLIRRTKDNNWYVPKETEHPVGWVERFKLFRKMYLGTPLRRIKFRHELRRAQKNTRAE